MNERSALNSAIKSLVHQVLRENTIHKHMLCLIPNYYMVLSASINTAFSSGRFETDFVTNKKCTKTTFLFIVTNLTFKLHFLHLNMKRELG